MISSLTSPNPIHHPPTHTLTNSTHAPWPPPPLSLQALGLRPEDVFTAEMLAEAMEESSQAYELELMQQQQLEQHVVDDSP